MVTARDIMAAKVIVQLGFVPPDEVRGELRALDKDAAATQDIVNRLTEKGRLQAKQIETVRHRVALYEHVRSEASYVRSLERAKNVSKQVVAELIAGLETSAFRRRLGEVLVKQGKLTKEQDAALQGAERDAMEKDDARVLDRYRKEDFAGVARGLIPGTKLEPHDFKISTLFRGKETRALVDKAELRAALAADAAQHVKAQQVEAPVEAPPVYASDEERVRATKRIADYSIVEVLGIGGMGAVFLAQREGTGEFVAIKVILNERASIAEKARFQREIDLTPLVKHRNVITLLGSGKTTTGMSFLVVPALAGKELRAYLKHAPDGLAPAVVLRIFEQLFSGMQAVHDAGILHRDLKPENVFVLAGGQHEVRIMDFGLAKLMKEREDAFRTMAGEIVGSPAYIAPETVQSDPADGRTDIYSLGVILFECLTGKRPIDSQTTMGFLTAHMVAPPLTLAEAAPERKWPPELEAYVAKLLGKSRDERPASARAALDELLAIKAQLLSVAPPAAAKPVTETKRIVSKSLLGRLG